jgi:hypothetical protein
MKRQFFILCIATFFYACAEKQPADAKTSESILIATDTTPIAVDTNQYLYDFIKIVEKDQKLNYGYGLTLEVNSTLSTTEDESYLYKFLKAEVKSIKKEAQKNDTTSKDTMQIALQNTPVLTLTPGNPLINSSSLFPNHIDRECLTNTDIKYMLAEKKRLQNFRWNNQRLGFNLANENNWYAFSLPYFSKNKKTALICIRSLCKPFLCGDGYVLLYRFENNKWTSTEVDYWVH